MNDRQRFALEHVLTDPDADAALRDLCTVDEQLRDGNILRSILAVDR